MALAPDTSTSICEAMTEMPASPPIPKIFDPARQHAQRSRAWARHRPGDGSDFLLARAAEDLADRVALVSREFDRTLEFFGHTGLTAQRLRQLPNVGAVDRMESVGKPDFRVTPDQFNTLPLKASHYNLIVAPLCLHMFDDLPGILVQLRRALVPDGLLLAALPAVGTLLELRTALLRAETDIRGGAALRMNPYAELQELTGLLQRTGYALPVGDVDEVMVRYKSPLGLMRDLRAMGQGNALSGPRPPLTRALLQRASDIYEKENADQDGRLRASFNMVSLSGWAPHESQQKPLKPGSAKTSLTSVLASSTPSKGSS
ncbi:MAG: methyltransferase domain-containing protein [Pseudomonadota bacterium]